MINLIRRIRHNHLRKFNKLFLILGNFYRTIIKLFLDPIQNKLKDKGVQLKKLT